MLNKCILIIALMLLSIKTEAFVEWKVEVKDDVIVETIITKNIDGSIFDEFLPVERDSILINGEKSDEILKDRLGNGLNEFVVFMKFDDIRTLNIEKRRLKVASRRIFAHDTVVEKDWKWKYIYIGINSSFWISLLATNIARIKINGSLPYMLDYQISGFIIGLSLLIYLFGNFQL